jgi:uncharacterized membrane protein YdfJ with MMPL/SSD domain
VAVTAAVEAAELIPVAVVSVVAATAVAAAWVQPLVDHPHPLVVGVAS